jgi:ATP-binding cassette subfamily B multidrug efflux pump
MYLGLMIWPMLALAWMFNIVERGSAAYSRIRAMLAEAPVVNDGSEAVPEGRGVMKAPSASLSIRKRNIRCWRTSIYASAGQMLGICGPTGAGKSTVLSLLQRHFDVTRAIFASTIFR